LTATAAAAFGLLALGALPLRAQEPAPSPDTRAGQWQALREEKAAQAPQPYRPTFLERQILAFEKAERPSLLNLNYKGFFPTLGTVSSGSRVAAGLRFWQPSLGATPLSLHASATFADNGYELYDLQLGQIPHREGARPAHSTRGDDVYELGSLARPGASQLILYGSLRYQHSPEERFFGVGPGSRLADRSNYLRFGGSYELVAGYQLNARTVATVRAGFFQPGLGEGGSDDFPSVQSLFDDTTAPGLAEQPDYRRLAGLVLLDHRDEPFNPHRGAMLAASVMRFDATDDAPYDFTRLAVDARGYLPLGSRQRVLAVRVLASHDEAADGSRVPFYLQEALANSHTLRGFETFRFRGEKLISLQAEYRWEPAPALELALFTDAARVAQSDEPFGPLEASYGVGLRLKTHRSTLLRFDAGWGGEGHRLYLRFSPAF
jgi:hypothetical protein